MKYGTRLALERGIGGFMTSTKQIFTILLAITTMAILTGCSPGGSDAGTNDQASRLPDDVGSTKPLAYCNSATGTDVSAKLKVFTDASNTVRMDYIYARITALPSGFAGGTSYIKMWKWLANSSGAAYLDNTALNFAIFNKNNQGLTPWMTTMKWSDVSAVAAGMGYSDPQTFFNNVNVLVQLNDTQGEYDALKITNYNASTNAVISSLDMLMPIFYASPTDYAVEPTGAGRATKFTTLAPFQRTNGNSCAISIYGPSFLFLRVAFVMKAL